MINFNRLLLSVLLLIGCGPGVSDYSESIDNTNLVYSDTGASRYIYVNNPDIYFKPVVDSRVLAYRKINSRVYVMRQVILSYSCDNPSRITSVALDLIEYYVLILNNKKFSNKIKFRDYEDFYKSISKEENKKLINEFSLDKVKGDLLPASILSNCDNPELIRS